MKAKPEAGLLSMVSNKWLFDTHDQKVVGFNPAPATQPTHGVTASAVALFLSVGIR